MLTELKVTVLIFTTLKLNMDEDLKAFYKEINALDGFQTVPIPRCINLNFKLLCKCAYFENDTISYPLSSQTDTNIT